MLGKGMLDKAKEATHVGRQEHTGQRVPLTPKVEAALRMHVAGLEGMDLSAYTYEKRHSDYMDAREDYVVYDETGRARFKGRYFAARAFAFWRA
jgi:hypothetical protein